MKYWYRLLRMRLKQRATSKWGIWILFTFAFADASFLPLPVTTFFLILVMMNKDKSYNYIVSVLLGTLIGAVAGYAIGRFAFLNIDGEFTGFGRFLFNIIPGFSESAYTKFQYLFSKYNLWILCGASATPVPYGIISIFSGAFEINIIIFLFAAFISQAVKFYLLAFSALKLGMQLEKVRMFNRKPMAAIASLFIGVVIFISTIFKNLFQIN